MFNKEMIKIIKSFLLNASINKIDLCATSIKLYFYYYFIIYIGRKYLNN